MNETERLAALASRLCADFPAVAGSITEVIEFDSGPRAAALYAVFTGFFYRKTVPTSAKPKVAKELDDGAFAIL